MKKPNRFLLAENPMTDDDRQYILHTVKPRILLEAHHDVRPFVLHQIGPMQFSFVNGDGVEEHVALVAVQSYDELTAHESMKAALSAAARWYRAYLEAEDDDHNLEAYARNN